MGPELKRASVLNDPLPHQVRGGTKAADVARPEFRLHPAALLALQRAAGNRAVSALLSPVQRDHHAPPAPKPTPQEAGWTDAKKEKGYKWNVDAQDVGEIHRIPLEGLTVGFQDAAKSSLTTVTDAKTR